MAVDSYGDRGQPQFSAQGGMDAGADETTLAKYASVVGTRRTGTTAQRLALASPDLFVDLLWRDTTVKADFIYTANGWVSLAEASGYVTTGTTGGGSISPVFWSSGVSVTFPVGLFSVSPIVTVSAQSNGIVWAQVEWASTTGASLKAMRLGSAPNAERINWTARAAG